MIFDCQKIKKQYYPPWLEYSVAIGKPERQVRKASHCRSKQQQRSPDEITLVVTVRKCNQLFTRFTSIVKGH